jgi:hypothetical protein
METDEAASYLARPNPDAITQCRRAVCRLRQCRPTECNRRPALATPFPAPFPSPPLRSLPIAQRAETRT